MVIRTQLENKPSTAEQLEVLQSQNLEKSPPEISQTTLLALEEMSKEGLIALVRLCNAREIDIALMDEEEIRKHFLHRLAVEGITNPDITKAMNAMDKRLNRTEGTPVQRSEASLDIKAVTVEVKAYEARNAQIDKILKLGKAFE